MATERKISTGRLKIEVAASEGVVPVVDAKIKVIDETGKSAEELTTDSSGHTETINLAAPPVELTETPQEEERPYSEFTIEVTAEGYKPIIVENVQIFGNTTAIQKVDMTGQDIDRDIVIPDHVQWGDYAPKIPEEEKKELSEASGLVVLDQTVIPEYIVVHIGRPDVGTTNYWIPFKDYIKNVACSEIYSTWPRETIKANVLAIISFTLNRVYTEWYRGRGYSFTITSATAYDQAYSYGRTIYKEISVIVDEIFSTYITKPGYRQPLFAQYCDGKNSTCPNWLSQWGSKYLGDKGYSAINILKNYYGSDIYFLQAKKVSGVPVSYPGRLLQVGSRGEDVRTIQKQLNAISNNFPAIPKIVADGIYGPKTRDAVKVFQQVFNLPVTGTVGYTAWYKISHIYVAVTKLVG